MKYAFAFLACFLFACHVDLGPSQGETELQASTFTTPEVVVAPSERPECPSDMVEIEGDYCPNLETKCLYNVDMEGHPKPGPGDLQYSCGEYQNPTRCLSDKTVHMHFCIDRYEWPNKEGQVPQDWMTWYDAKKSCESIGKRMCLSHEWTLAAEGPERHPLPYGDGFHRTQECNIDRQFDHTDIMNRRFDAKTPNSPVSQELRSLLVPSGSMPNCHSDYGVYDLAGNVDEFVVNESHEPYVSGLKGGHIWHVRQASRPMTEAHGPTFSWYETSSRCCEDIP